MKLPRFKITYYDADRPPDIVRVGAWEMVLCERKFGQDAITDPPLEAVLYQAFLGAKACKLVPKELDFDNWGRDVALVESADEGEPEDKDEDGPGESQAPPAI